MNEAEALTTLLSNSPMAAALLFLGFKARNAFDRFMTALENIIASHKETSTTQTENKVALEANTIALNKATQAATQGGK